MLRPGSSVAILDFNNSAAPATDAAQAWALGNVVVPAARMYGLEEEYAYLRPSIQRFPTGGRTVLCGGGPAVPAAIDTVLVHVYDHSFRRQSSAVVPCCADVRPEGGVHVPDVDAAFAHRRCPAHWQPQTAKDTGTIAKDTGIITNDTGTIAGAGTVERGQDPPPPPPLLAQVRRRRNAAVPARRMARNPCHAEGLSLCGRMFGPPGQCCT